MASNHQTRSQNITYIFLALILCLVVDNVEHFGIQKSILATAEPTSDAPQLLPTVVIATLVRNKAHSLPWFLGLVEKLDYPTHRISLWLQSDHNVDNSTAMLKEWIAAVSHLYHSVVVEIDEEKTGYPDEESPCDWTEQRFTKVIDLREKALQYARNVWADYIFMVDADVTLENSRTLQILMGQKKFVIGPMLNSSVEGLYSNFWGGMTEKGYYVRSDNYVTIVDREELGVFPVPMVHSALLIDLHHYLSPNLSYSNPSLNYTGPRDDIIMFAHCVQALGETMHVINTEYFGKVMIPLDKRYTLLDESDHFDHVKLEAMVQEVPPLYNSPHVHVPEKPKDKLGFDEIYMINLKRRPARRLRMIKAFDYLGIDAKSVDAVDGKEINDSYLDERKIEMLPGFADPYQGRSLTMGEIGCFLSHYQIWEERLMVVNQRKKKNKRGKFKRRLPRKGDLVAAVYFKVVAKNYQKIVIFEDDVRFEPYFRRKLVALMQEVEETFDAWDLIYLGRKRLRKDLETMVEGSHRLAWPHYSYWTISYILSNSGAKKLLGQKPLSKMLPVDEYLPIMFDRHPEDKWKLQFSPRDLIGLSAEPYLLYPTHYTGEQYYFSDTEDSIIIAKESQDNDAAVNEDVSGNASADDKERIQVHDDLALQGPLVKDEL